MSEHQAVSQLHFFILILDTLFKHPDHGLSDFLSISPDELEQLWSWNSPMPSDMQICHHEMIAEQVAQQPDKVAIEAWDGELTYRQIEDYSTHLAQTLLLLDDSPNPVAF
jgi:non-ribosomal peptide synthetase component F